MSRLCAGVRLGLGLGVSGERDVVLLLMMMKTTWLQVLAGLIGGLLRDEYFSRVSNALFTVVDMACDL